MTIAELTMLFGMVATIVGATAVIIGRISQLDLRIVELSAINTSLNRRLERLERHIDAQLEDNGSRPRPYCNGTGNDPHGSIERRSA